jgi:DNA-binding GntR family transcriptional regulator
MPPVVSRTVLREQVKDLLLERILRGEVKPGERLVETRIAQELGTSQTPVREALRDLELLRLVESEAFRGSRVRAFTEEELLAVFPVRAVLEELAAKLAAKRLRGDVSELEREVDAMLDAARRGDTRAHVARDIGFHKAVVEASGNPLLLQAWLALGIEVPTAFGVYWTYFDPLELVEFHRPIVDAIRSRNAARAGLEARRHVRRTEQVIRRRQREG